MPEKILPPDYTRDQAARLICACYNQNGANVDSSLLERSILEESLGELPETWNAGLFRFLDESIYLIKLLGYFALAKAFQDKKNHSLAMLIYQIEKNLLAVRVLTAAGLDASARQNLRAIFEMCQALCRCVLDDEFSENFSKPQTEEEANKFWHEFIAKGKTTQFLKEYNKKGIEKCPLVMDGVFDYVHKSLGVSAHPNSLGWSLDFLNDWKNFSSDTEQLETMFQFSPKTASEMVLVTTSEIAFLTIHFYSNKIAPFQSTLGLLNDNPLFKHLATDEDAIEAIGKNAALMFLMLNRLIDHKKKNSDSKAHH